jgi:hypothetical protein
MSLERALDRAIARENANPQGLPADVLAGMETPELLQAFVDAAQRKVDEATTDSERSAAEALLARTKAIVGDKGVTMDTYKVVRFYRDNRPAETQQTGLTLADAQARCRDESTHGDGWFDGWMAE